MAYAAPATPISKLIMNTKSNTILVIEEITKSTNGTTLFPIALKILASRLYNTLHAIPAQIITIYSLAISKISSGVFIHLSKVFIPAILTYVIIIAVTIDKIAALPILLFIASRSPAP